MDSRTLNPEPAIAHSSFLIALLQVVLFTALIILFDVWTGWTGRGISYIIGRDLVSGLIYAAVMFLFRRYR